MAFDLLGHGQSARPKDELAYTTSALAEDCLYLFNKYRTARNVLIGHSYGSALAVFMASEVRLKR